MFSTWKNDKFLALYNQVQTSAIGGGIVFRWNAGDTGAEEHVIELTQDYLAAVNAEYEHRFPQLCGRRRATRTRVVFS